MHLLKYGYALGYIVISMIFRIIVQPYLERVICSESFTREHQSMMVYMQSGVMFCR